MRDANARVQRCASIMDSVLFATPCCAPRSSPGYSVPVRRHLISPISPTRGHIAISPHSGLYGTHDPGRQDHQPQPDKKPPYIHRKSASAQGGERWQHRIKDRPRAARPGRPRARLHLRRRRWTISISRPGRRAVALVANDGRLVCLTDATGGIEPTARILDASAVLLRPQCQRVDRLQQRAAQPGQFIIHTWRNDRKHRARHQSVTLQRA
jgi:hypothetical protein